MEIYMDPFDNMTEFTCCPFMEAITAYDCDDDDERMEKGKGFFPKGNQADRIFNIIRRDNPMIIRRLVNCGIPEPQAERLIKRIITISLSYCR